MNTQTRLITLLCVLLAMFGAGLAYLRYAQHLEAEAMLKNLRDDRAELLDSLLELTGESLKNFAHDYSYWDEMLEFAARPELDRAWAQVNIDASLPTFHAHGAWLLATDGRQIYGVVQGLDEALRRLPAPVPTLLARLQRERFLHFYERTPAGLLEFRAAPLQPSDDAERRSPPRGWFIAARLWDEAQLRSLERVIDSELELIEVPHRELEHDHEFNGVHLQREMRDHEGRAVMFLHAHHMPEPLAVLLRDNQNDLYLFGLTAALILVVTTAGISHWVIRPLRRLEQSLAEGTPEPLGVMIAEKDEFGRLAQLTAASFEQRRQLEREIDDRRRAEAALLASQNQLRESAELKSRLARDLHDGVIQSIYAAGLGLEGMRASLRTDPAAAERRLNAAQSSLNQTIREVRSFIQGLEPDETMQTEFTAALRSLVATLQTLHSAEITLQLEQAIVRLSAREEVHALQMVRECVSNAIRHGAATAVQVGLRLEQGRPHLEIRDDGRGFDPVEARTRGGSGLGNLASRAAEIEARLDIRSAPGQGTVVTILFSPRPTAP